MKKPINILNTLSQHNNTSGEQPKGATSLLLVIGMAMVFIVMITGLTSLSIRQSRQASNTDLSNRALATAEASARDAALWVQANPGQQYPACAEVDNIATAFNELNLSKYNPTSSDTNSEIVCRTITTSSKTPKGQIKKDESVQLFTYEPSPSTGVDTMLFQWGKNAAVLPSGFASYPTLAFYSTIYSNAPAFVEISFYYWPKSTYINPVDGIKVKTVLLLARESSTGDGSGGVTVANDNTGRLNNSVCSATLNSDGYNCKVGINLSSVLGVTTATNYNIIAKLRPRYKDTDYQASFCPAIVNQITDTTNACSANAVEIRSSRALIDVTARVGSLYRRIQAETEIDGSSFFDDVLYSDEAIDKNLKVCGNSTLFEDPTCSPKI